MQETRYVKNDWNAICDRCGFELKASKLKKEWNGLRVCKACWEPRHPQDFQRSVKEDTSVPWTRPEGTDVETDTSGWAATTTSVPTGTFDNEI